MSIPASSLPKKYQDQIAGQFYAPHHRRKIPDPKPKHDETAALEPAGPDTKESFCRPIVRFTLHRVQPLDPDNAAGSCKDLLDGLRHAGLIPGDEAWRIKFGVEQEKVAHYKDEKTVIEIVTP